MQTQPAFIHLAFVLVLALSLPNQNASAAEYFVSVDGKDANSGTSQNKAFASVQRGLTALKPGDILTIRPGEYFGAALIEDLGNADTQTTIRAEIPGTVTLRGDVPAPEFRKVDDLLHVYVTDFKEDVQSVNEVDTLSIFCPPRPSPQDLDFHPGSYHYDEAAGKLYISSSDFRPVTDHVYTVSVQPHSGLALIRPTRVVIDGLAATGYNSRLLKPLTHADQQGVNWGFWLESATDSEIRNSVAYLNSSGIGVCNGRTNGSGRNLIENCEVYANGSPFVSAGGIMVYFSNNDIIRNCLAWNTERFAFRFYQQGAAGAHSEGNVATSGEIAIKGAKDPEVNVVRAGVGLQNIDAPRLEQSLVGLGNRRLATEGTDPQSIFLIDEADLNMNEEFADPLNADFRLQSTSRFRAQQPDAKDRGPQPFQPDVFFVSPDGDDERDGLSVSTSWKSLDRALRDLKAGQTLYLMAGRYEISSAVQLQGTAAKNIHLRGRGTDQVIIEGSLAMNNCEFVAVERLQFQEEVIVKESMQVSFSNCIFLGRQLGLTAISVDDLRVTHNLFDGFQEAGLSLDFCQSVFLRGNAFNNAAAAAIKTDSWSALLHSDHNGFVRPDNLWLVANETSELALGGDNDMRAENYSVQLPPPVELGRWKSLAGRGPSGRSLGPETTLEKERKMRLVSPRVHSVSATTANLEWQTNHLAVCEIAWGETPDCPNRQTVDVNSFGSLSLTNLQPATKYYFKILSAKSPGALPIPKQARDAEIEGPVLTFTTKEKDAPGVTYFVSNDGDNSNSGLSREKAWQTLNHAASQVKPGDIVMVAGGDYHEAVRLRSTGTKEAPIRFQAMPGEKVLMTGSNKQLNTLFYIHGKSHQEIDGFYFRDMNSAGGSQTTPVAQAAVISVIGSDDVSVTRCFYDARGGGYSPAFLVANRAPGLLVKNCAIVAPMHSMYVTRSPGFTLENCVFIRSQIGTLHAGDPANDVMIVRNNVFTDSLAHKPNAGILALSRKTIEGNNSYFFRKGRDRLAFRISQGATPADEGVLLDYEQLKTVLKPSAPSHFSDPELKILKSVPVEVMKKFREANARPITIELGRVYYSVDYLANSGAPELDFPDLFVTDPALIKAGVGLQPEVFKNVE